MHPSKVFGWLPYWRKTEIAGVLPFGIGTQMSYQFQLLMQNSPSIPSQWIFRSISKSFHFSATKWGKVTRNRHKTENSSQLAIQITSKSKHTSFSPPRYFQNNSLDIDSNSQVWMMIVKAKPEEEESKRDKKPQMPRDARSWRWAWDGFMKRAKPSPYSTNPRLGLSAISVGRLRSLRTR